MYLWFIYRLCMFVHFSDLYNFSLAHGTHTLTGTKHTHPNAMLRFDRTFVAIPNPRPRPRTNPQTLAELIHSITPNRRDTQLRARPPDASHTPWGTHPRGCVRTADDRGWCATDRTKCSSSPPLAAVVLQILPNSPGHNSTRRRLPEQIPGQNAIKAECSAPGDPCETAPDYPKVARDTWCRFH
jgi:hypothetical protein